MTQKYTQNTQKKKNKNKNYNKKNWKNRRTNKILFQLKKKDLKIILKFQQNFNHKKKKTLLQYMNS